MKIRSSLLTFSIILTFTLTSLGMELNKQILLSNLVKGKINLNKVYIILFENTGVANKTFYAFVEQAENSWHKLQTETPPDVLEQFKKINSSIESDSFDKFPFDEGEPIEDQIMAVQKILSSEINAFNQWLKQI